MFTLSANTPRWILIVMDLGISLVALFLAYLIRFDLNADRVLMLREWGVLSKSLGIFLFVKWIVFYGFNIHKGLVRHTSTEDIRRIFIAVFTCSMIYFILGLVRYQWYDQVYLFPVSILILEAMTSFMLMLGSRFTIKLIYLESIRSKHEEERVLIYGAGVSGLITKRTIEKDARLHYKLIGFMDDNRKMAGTRLEGMPIFSVSSLEKLIRKELVSMVIIAIQHPDEEKRKKVVEICLKYQVKVQQVPNPKRWINGEFSAKQMAGVKIEDLLGRKPIVLDETKLFTELSGKAILITGAAGSIGSGLVRQLARYKPGILYLLDQAESPMYDFQYELYTQYPELTFEVVIGDIRSFERMERLFSHAQPDYVFHAAAYKHVPLMENNPSEAVLTNIKGTKNLVDLSIRFQVIKFVMISTDKAVNPTNVMGASKRIAEMYAQLADDSGNTRFIITRFGNVLGSNGSVIPLFRKQIENGGPITITDERVTRFFMTIPEACQLVLEAGVMGDGSEIFVFDMGESVRIIDLARKMIRLSGLEEGKDIEIRYTGLRPGEKLFEELLAEEENTIPTHHPKILKAKVRPAELEVKLKIIELIDLFESQQNEKIVAKMKEIVPEFISNNSAFEKLDKR